MPLRLSFEPQAWDDYQYWQQTDKILFKKLNALIADIRRKPLDGIGKPEPLKHQHSGYWSRRINEEHRIIYTIQEETVLIAQCRYHYQP